MPITEVHILVDEPEKVITTWHPKIYYGRTYYPPYKKSKKERTTTRRWNFETQTYETVEIPEYAQNIIKQIDDDNVEVIDEYDMCTGAYKKREETRYCANCGKCPPSHKRKYAVVLGKVVTVCSRICAMELKGGTK